MPRWKATLMFHPSYEALQIISIETQLPLLYDVSNSNSHTITITVTATLETVIVTKTSILAQSGQSKKLCCHLLVIMHLPGYVTAGVMPNKSGGITIFSPLSIPLF